MTRSAQDDEIFVDDGELFLMIPPTTNSGKSLRRSPRKKNPTNDNDLLVLTANATATTTATAMAKQSKASPSKKRKEKSEKKIMLSPASNRLTAKSIGIESGLMNIPILPRKTTTTTWDRNGDFEASSNNKSSPGHLRKPVRIVNENDVDSLLGQMSKVSLNRENNATKQQSSVRTSPRKKDQRSTINYASRFVLKDARCNDDLEDSTNEDEEDEDEDTDLSGFIVDDDAELSYHESSTLESEDQDHDQKERRRIKTKVNESVKPRRRLYRGTSRSRPVGKSGNSDKENDLGSELSGRLKELDINSKIKDFRQSPGIEIIDLTSSPAKPDQIEVKPKSEDIHDPFDASSIPVTKKKHVLETSHPFDQSGAILRFSPPRSYSPMKIPTKLETAEPIFDTKQDKSKMDLEEKEQEHPKDKFTTPPTTPPRSPSKLKSPSKLLSPTKRNDGIPRSPHRQSMDAFWDLNTINEWTDQYSPKKAPVTSPRKRGLERFRIWSDSEEEDENENMSNDSLNSLPSPCSSPRRQKSPLKSPEKLEKKRLADEKRAAIEKKRRFDSQKEQLAIDLLKELDDKVTSSQLKKLATGTGGIQVLWSKTLRSTAGRANWRRTITKPSGSPVKSGATNEILGIKIQHFANIELAEKVIDSEERLVNTLAHEFCHLANFMISGIRDQPHGTSFKNWANKVTCHLRATDNQIWNKVEVTTKHSYIINHKYLWICIGRETSKAMEFLNLEDDEGCGAEYGRHSKSIDPDKHRCGRCKGRLIQVRPKPRTVPTVKKKNNGSSDKIAGRKGDIDAGNGLEKLVEVVELDD